MDDWSGEVPIVLLARPPLAPRVLGTGVAAAPQNRGVGAPRCLNSLGRHRPSIRARDSRKPVFLELARVFTQACGCASLSPAGNGSAASDYPCKLAHDRIPRWVQIERCRLTEATSISPFESAVAPHPPAKLHVGRQLRPPRRERGRALVCLKSIADNLSD